VWHDTQKQPYTVLFLVIRTRSKGSFGTERWQPQTARWLVSCPFVPAWLLIHYQVITGSVTCRHLPGAGQAGIV